MSDDGCKRLARGGRLEDCIFLTGGLSCTAPALDGGNRRVRVVLETVYCQSTERGMKARKLVGEVVVNLGSTR